MSLERKLAETEILIEDLKDRSRDYYSIKEYLDGVAGELDTLYRNYGSAKRTLVWGSENASNRSVGQFALTAKNLADNLSFLMQTLYGVYPVKLQNLEKNLENSPVSEDGENLSELFLDFHDYEQDSPLMVARNLYGHGRTNNILQPVGQERFLHIGGVNASDWLDTNFGKYFGLVNECLRTISKNDEINFNEEGKKPNIFLRTVKNYLSRHKRTAVTSLAGASLVAGVFGTLLFQDIQKREDLELIQEAHQLLNGSAGIILTEKFVGTIQAYVDSCDTHILGELMTRGRAPGFFKDKLWDAEFEEFKIRYDSGVLFDKTILTKKVAEKIFLGILSKEGYSLDRDITLN